MGSGQRPNLRAVQGGQAPIRDIAGVVPPHDLDAEAAVLSAAILQAAALTSVAELLLPEMFYSDSNGRIWEALLALLAAGQAVDLVTLAGWLRERGVFEAVGGTAYLVQISDATPAVANVRAHAEIVFEKWRARKAIAFHQRKAAEAYGDVGPLQDWLDTSTEELCDIARAGKGAGGPRRLRDAFAETMEELLGYQPGKMTGYPTGILSLDELTGGLHGGEIILLKAPRKMGKTALAGQLSATLAGNPERLPAEPVPEGVAPGPDRWKWRGAAVFALEGKLRDWSTRLACASGRVDYNALRTGTASPGDIARFIAAADRMKDLPIRIDDRKDLTPAKLAVRVRAVRDELAADGAELSIVVLDNMQLWPTAPGDRRDRTPILDEAMRMIVALAAAKDLSKVVWVILSQLNKDGDSRDCKALEAHADTLWRLHADDEKTADQDGAVAARITIEAQRRGKQGVNASFWFYPRYTLFWDRG